MYFKNKNKNTSLINISQMQMSDPTALKDALIELNSETSEYGLVLTVKQVNKLADCVQKALRESDRVEIGAGIMPILAAEFCTSVFVTRENYASVLEELIYVFFQVKTAVCDRISDRDLVRLLKDYYENKAFGSVEIMRERDIDRLIKYIEMEMDSDSSAIADVYESDGYADERA